LIESHAEERIVMEEFYEGYDRHISSDELLLRQRTIEQFENKMKNIHNWTENYPPSWFGAHDCSEMIISLGKAVKNVSS
jgi:hypothetical protein